MNTGTNAALDINTSIDKTAMVATLELLSFLLDTLLFDRVKVTLGSSVEFEVLSGPLAVVSSLTFSVVESSRNVVVLVTVELYIFDDFNVCTVLLGIADGFKAISIT